MKVTGDTITDEQIDSLREEANALILAAKSALLPKRGNPVARRDGREACAAIWNARHGDEP